MPLKNRYSIIETKIMLSNLARWPEPNAGWRVGMRGEAYLALDFFRSFCIKAKRTEQEARTPQFNAERKRSK
jgi:hypothetical protein